VRRLFRYFSKLHFFHLYVCCIVYFLGIVRKFLNSQALFNWIYIIRMFMMTLLYFYLNLFQSHHSRRFRQNENEVIIHMLILSLMSYRVSESNCELWLKRKKYITFHFVLCCHEGKQEKEKLKWEEHESIRSKNKS
jgi:phosphatidylglycerophosphate synthase